MRGAHGSNPLDKPGGADDAAAMDVAPIRRTVANRVCAKSSFASRRPTCSTSKNRSFPNAAPINYVSRCCFGCLFASDGGIPLPDTYRQNPYLDRAARQPQKVPLGLLNILAGPIYTKRFQLRCIKHVTGLFVSRLFNSGPVLPFHAGSQPGSMTQRQIAPPLRRNTPSPIL